jgi:hypothetical protein
MMGLTVFVDSLEQQMILARKILFTQITPRFKVSHSNTLLYQSTRDIQSVPPNIKRPAPLRSQPPTTKNY